LIFLKGIINGIVFLYYFSICSLPVYRKATDLCKLILYSAALLKQCLCCLGVFRWSFFGLGGIGSCCLQIGILRLFLYLFVFLVFLLFALLLWLGIPGLCWIWVGRCSKHIFPLVPFSSRSFRVLVLQFWRLLINFLYA
jgi:hypothetical protein